MEQIVTTYVVGTKVRTALEEVPEGFYTCDTSDKRFHTPQLPRFYRDTRSELGHDDFNDIFTSSVSPISVTTYHSWEAAEKWNQEFLKGEGVVYRF